MPGCVVLPIGSIQVFMNTCGAWLTRWIGAQGGWDCGWEEWRKRCGSFRTAFYLAEHPCLRSWALALVTGWYLTGSSRRIKHVCVLVTGKKVPIPVIQGCYPRQQYSKSACCLDKPCTQAGLRKSAYLDIRLEPWLNTTHAIEGWEKVRPLKWSLRVAILWLQLSSNTNCQISPLASLHVLLCKKIRSHNFCISTVPRYSRNMILKLRYLSHT